MSAVPGSIPSAQLAPQTMAARRARIRILLSSVIVGSQDELRLMLAAEGIRVTQTTLSRDLDGLGAIKVADESGHVQYVLPDESGPNKRKDASGEPMGRIVGDVLIGAEAAMNIAVLHTPPGAAHYLAGSLDRSGTPGIVGTVAGDDTVIVILRTQKAAEGFCADLLTIAERTSSSRKPRARIQPRALGTRQRRIS